MRPINPLDSNNDKQDLLINRSTAEKRARGASSSFGIGPINLARGPLAEFRKNGKPDGDNPDSIERTPRRSNGTPWFSEL